MHIPYTSDNNKNIVSIFNVNSTIKYNEWNLVKLEICKMYNNNSNNLKVTINKNNEITGTQNKTNDILIKFYDYVIETDSVESVNFNNYINNNNIIFYNINFLPDYKNVKYEVDFFNNIIDTIKKTKKISLVNNLLT